MTEHRFCPPRCGWVNLAMHAPPTSARILNSPHSSDRSHTVREMEPVLSAERGKGVGELQRGGCTRVLKGCGGAKARNVSQVSGRWERMRRRAWLATRLFTKPGAFQDKLAEARAMRKAPRGGEAALWIELRERRLGGWKFRRQQVIAGYLVDFYCAELRLAIEVDGAVHDARGAEDEQRDDDLGALGLGVLRVRDADVLARRDGVLRTIAARCESIAQQTGLQRRHARARKR